MSSYYGALKNESMSSYILVECYLPVRATSSGQPDYYTSLLPADTYSSADIDTTSLILTASVTQTADLKSLTGTWTLTGNLYIRDWWNQTLSSTAFSDSGTISRTWNGSGHDYTITSASGGFESSTEEVFGVREENGVLFLYMTPDFVGPQSTFDYTTTVAGPAADESDPKNLTGTEGNDVLPGGLGDDTITGGGGDDSISAGAGNDTVYGGSGDDTIDGGEGADYMEGGAGADTYYVDDKKDQVVENNNDPDSGSALVLDADIGSIIDSVISSVSYTLTNYVENLTLADSTAKLAGTGNTLDNELIGNDGANKLTAGAGNDTLDGGAGIDQLLGGTGSDTFRFSNLATDGADTIKDFADEDILFFDTSVFTQLIGAGSGNLVQGSAAADDSDYLIYNIKGGALYYDADGWGSGAAIKIAAIKGTDAKTITIDDFMFG